MIENEASLTPDHTMLRIHHLVEKIYLKNEEILHIYFLNLAWQPQICWWGYLILNSICPTGHEIILAADEH